MENVLVNPYWLFGYDVVFNIVLTFITAAVSYYSYKAYELAQTKKARLFSAAFGLYSFAYLMQAIFGVLAVMGIGNTITMIYFGTYIHLLAYIMATVTLVYMEADVERPGLFSLLLTVSLIPLLFFGMNLYLEYVIISSLLLYIFLKYLLACLRKQTMASYLIPAAFGLILVSDLHLIFSLHNPIFYIIGNIVELVAYILILVNLIVALTKK